MPYLKIVTYNVHFGADTQGISTAFKTTIELAEADIIFLQEIEFHQNETISRAEKIAQQLGMYFFYAPSRLLPNGGSHGIATLSKYPLLQNTIIKLPRFNLLINSRQRIALISTIQVNGVHITLCNAHLDARLNAKERLIQLDTAVQYVKKHNDTSVILGGDFNTIPMFLAARSFPIFFQNQPKLLHQYLLGQGFHYFCEFKQPTMQRGLLKMHLDHIYTSNLPVLHCGVSKQVQLSDHVPVWAEVSLPAT